MLSEKIESFSELIKPDKTAFRTVHHIGLLFCFVLINFILLERRNNLANDVNKQNNNKKTFKKQWYKKNTEANMQE